VCTSSCLISRVIAASDLKRLAGSVGLRGWDEGCSFPISTLDQTRQPIKFVLLLHRQSADNVEEIGGVNDDVEAVDNDVQVDRGGDVFLADVSGGEVGGNIGDVFLADVSGGEVGGDDVASVSRDKVDAKKSKSVRAKKSRYVGGKKSKSVRAKKSKSVGAKKSKSEGEEVNGDSEGTSKLSLGGDPPWRTTVHRYLQRKVIWTPPRGNKDRLPCQPFIGTIVAWISENDKDSEGNPGFVCTRTKMPDPFFINNYHAILSCIFPKLGDGRTAS